MAGANLILVRHFLVAVDNELSQSIHSDALAWLFSDFQLFFSGMARVLLVLVLGGGGEKVDQVFIVEFKHACSHQILLGVGCVLYGFEDVADGPWNDARELLLALHCKGLAGSSLSVGENGAVVSLENTLDDRQGTLLEH